mmetsp:Transcript_5112/g.15485  ORF Transcript_5112/g.15485 Transcript_5112/m.15485 type:complete len:211 (-) Transcript_5112:314-946(-)
MSIARWPSSNTSSYRFCSKNTAHLLLRYVTSAPSAAIASSYFASASSNFFALYSSFPASFSALALALASTSACSSGVRSTSISSLVSSSRAGGSSYRCGGSSRRSSSTPPAAPEEKSIPRAKLNTSCIWGSWNMVCIAACGLACRKRNLVMNPWSERYPRNLGCCARRGIKSGPNALASGLSARSAACSALVTSSNPERSAASSGFSSNP